MYLGVYWNRKDKTHLYHYSPRSATLKWDLYVDYTQSKTPALAFPSNIYWALYVDEMSALLPHSTYFKQLSPSHQIFSFKALILSTALPFSRSFKIKLLSFLLLFFSLSNELSLSWHLNYLEPHLCLISITSFVFQPLQWSL